MAPPDDSGYTPPLSQAKIEANRANAKKSTGPRTGRGKRFSSRNSVKHGIFAFKGIFVRDILHPEDSAEAQSFIRLLNQLERAYQPQGRVEELLVEKIATYWWRLRRLLRAESGEINRATVAAGDEFYYAHVGQFYSDLNELIAMGVERIARKADVAVPVIEGFRSRHKVVENLRRTEMGIQFLRTQLVESRREFEVTGVLTEERRAWLLDCLGVKGDFLTATNDSFKNHDQIQKLLIAIDKELALLDSEKSLLATKNKMLYSANQRLARVPLDLSSDKLIRYEAHIERLLNRAMDQLERLQRQRKGDLVPPPTKLELG
jgi:hypothetical protein